MEFDPITAVFAAILSIGATLVWQRHREQAKQKRIKRDYHKKVEKDAASKLSNHSNEFNKKEVLKVGKNVYVAIGYGLANSIMLEGEEGVIIIDTLESCEVAREVRAAFEEVTTKPVVGIILTHFHADHAYGTAEFLRGREEGEVEIFAHESFPTYFRQVMDVRSPITFRRAVRQFGTEIPEETKKNAGIGLNLRFDGSSTTSYVYPTKVFSDRLKVNLAGISLELIHAPGETNDQIIVSYPEQGILFPADNIYKAFPNLYAIRGCMHRDTLQWVAALDTMIAIQPSTLVPQHTRPIYGQEEVLSTLTAYRDAIQFVHDQTVRWMNKGFSVREIAEKVTLPPHLADHPYLTEYYGTVEWSVKAVYHGYLGWFSGRPADLHPLPREDEAQRWVELGGGEEEVLEKAAVAVDKGEHQWGLQLTDILIDSGRESDRARELRGVCLRKLAGREVSAPGMNWYLTEDLVQEGLQIRPSPRATAQRIFAGDMLSLFKMLTVMLDSEATQNVNSSCLFRFNDTEEEVGVIVRRGVCILAPTLEKPDITVQVSSKVWREVLAKQRTALAASLTGEIRVEPGIQALATFFQYFDTEQV